MAIDFNGTSIETTEKGYLENYSKTPSVIKEILKAKIDFIKNINSFATAMGAKFEIKLSENLEKENKELIKELEVTENDEPTYKPYSYTLPYDYTLQLSEDANIEYNKLKLLIFFIKSDDKIHAEEKIYMKALIYDSGIPEENKQELELWHYLQKP